MAYVIEKGSAYSPESTITSLLASWSLKSHRNSSIQYKNKLYTSATHALEDYIEDFDLSRTSPDVKPGKICFTPNVSKVSRCMKENSRGKYALGNSHAVVSPVISQRRRKSAYDPDLLSLTTDDLLAFPADGSLSFTHMLTLRSLPQSNIRNRKSTSCDRQWTSCLDNKEKLNFPNNPIGSPPQKDFSRIVQAKRTLRKYSCELSLAEKLTEEEEEEEKEESDLHKNYPRWLTGQKSDLGVSEISSIPDFKYPMWLRSNNLLPVSSNDSSSQIPESDPTFLQDIKTFQKSQNSVTSGNRSGRSDIQRDTHNALPGVNFTSEEIRDHKHLFRDEATELLLQNPRKYLKSSADELTNALGNYGSPCTVDVLEAERSWDNVPVGLKAPVPVCCEEDQSWESPKASIFNEFLEDCLKSGQQESTFSGGNHHGPVEALKFMLFNLQAVQHSLNQKKTVGQNEEAKTDSDEDVEFNLCDGDTIPVRKSLQRALHHLSRLKNLVEDTGGKDEST